MSEREILGREVIEIARDPRAARIDDERIHDMIKTMTREHRGFLDRQLTIDDCAGELRREADDNPRGTPNHS